MPPASSSKKSKTSRFPVARIKKIMQMDEEVGKLASATPVMISKSLECFIQALLHDAVVEANRRGSRKLTAYHLKQSINANESFDFLREIVSTIPDPTAADLAPSGGGGGGGGGRGGGVGRPRKPRAAGTAGGGGGAAGIKEEQSIPDSKPTGLPDIGTWKRDMTGGGGTGEGGRGMYDDYDVDDDDF